LVYLHFFSNQVVLSTVSLLVPALPAAVLSVGGWGFASGVAEPHGCAPVIADSREALVGFNHFKSKSRR
jgi:hypothetical protein